MSIFPPRPRRIKGHALKMEWSGEYGVESSSTGFCKCGWEESASSQNEVRNEYGFHLSKVQQFAEEGVTLDFEGPSSYSPWFVEQSPKGTVAMSANATVTVTYQGKSVCFDLEGKELSQGSDHQYLSTASQGYIAREVEKALIEVTA